jgi:rare lipoprotein A (peptidoglycan hydrolase)
MKNHTVITLGFISFLTALTIYSAIIHSEPRGYDETPLISPIPESTIIVSPSPSVSVSPSPTPTIQVIPELQVEKQPRHSGLASYYSRAGCVGCSPTMTMANGQSLDDSRLTVAFNRAKLNSKVKVINVKTGQSVIATVTDRGGFEAEKYNVNGKQRIIDLTVATKEAINCSDLCTVEV